MYTAPVVSPDPLTVGPAADLTSHERAGRLLVLLPVQGHRLVLDADGVREVVTVVDVTPLPHVSPALQGAVAVRGALLPLYDVTRWCGSEGFGDHDGSTRFATILEIEGGCFAIETSEHPTIAMSSTEISHRQPIVVVEEVCIGVDPVALLADLTEPTDHQPVDEGTAR